MNFAWVVAAVVGIAVGNIVKRITGKYMNLGGRGRIWQTKADFERTVGSKVSYEWTCGCSAGNGLQNRGFHFHITFCKRDERERDF